MGDTDKATNTDELGKALDRLSLEQALQDCDVANARIIDLTVRLNATHQRAQSIRHEMAALEAQHAALQAVHHAAVTSTSYRLSGRIRSVRSLIRKP